jgi:hypothetical protein
MICVQTGCTEKKPESVDSTLKDTMIVDSADTDTATRIIAETPMPKAADQLFDDFFFNFISNKKLQRSRIKYPLVVYTGKSKSIINAGQWKNDRFFARQGYYTLIFDNEKQMDYAKSTDIDTVIVERIHLKKGLVEQYWFDHQDGKWKLNSIHNIGFSLSNNASFLKFLQRFFINKGSGMVKDPLSYSGPDPYGDETAIVNTQIPASEWMGFLPEVPGDVVYNILYGQEYSDASSKILIFKGLSNGLETQLVFTHYRSNWHLTKVNAY